ncbi:divergent PAP2 family protein, partial [Chloroflexota bacterium]
VFFEIITNKVLIIPVCSWAIAQLLKIIIILIRTKQLDLRYLVISGGMPSSHSAVVSALATALAVVEGVGSVAFGISAIFALVVMYDAAGVRQSVGQQSKVLNRILHDLRVHRPMTSWGRDLREFIGHTSYQVIVGGLLGIVVAWSWLTITGY